MTAGPCESLVKIELIIDGGRNDPPRRSEAKPLWMNDSKPSARRGVRWSVVEGAQDQRACPDEQEALVDADLDTLATALYVRTDDLLKASPDRAPWRPRAGSAP